ncbi:MAG TPA: IPT/TIG domain-containing protein [Puia sp.]|nr:IPT/TIG domain-containing protein [Puia sp.]
MKLTIPIIALSATILLPSLACRKSSVGAGVVHSISPVSGHFGTVLTIHGDHFDINNGYVMIGGVKMPVTRITDTTITLTMTTTHTAPVIVKSTTGGSTTGPVFTYLTDTLVAGELTLNPGVPVVGFPYAYYWDNGIPFMLRTILVGTTATTTGIVASGNDIFACGYQYYGQHTYALLWKNGAEEDLSQMASQDARANAIAASGNNVYVVGYLNTGNHAVATVWVNGQPTALSADTVDSYANAIAISGNDIYIAGYRNQSNSSNHVALFWKNGDVTSLSDGSADATTTGIAVGGADVYVSGNMGGGILWKDGSSQALSFFPTSLTAFNGILYLAGESVDYSGYSASVTTWGTASPGYYLGGLSVNAVTADSTGVYTANSGPSYSICTGQAAVTTVSLPVVSPQGFGAATAIYLRH